MRNPARDALEHQIRQRCARDPDAHYLMAERLGMAFSGNPPTLTGLRDAWEYVTRTLDGAA